MTLQSISILNYTQFVHAINIYQRGDWRCHKYLKMTVAQMWPGGNEPAPDVTVFTLSFFFI
jgi:hypothetical protein